MADYYTHFVFELHFATPEIAEQALADFRRMLKRTAKYEDRWGGLLVRRSEVSARTLWISDDGGAPDLDLLIETILDFARRDWLTGRLGFQYAETCSRREQILAEAAQMRGRRLVAERALARQKVFHERHDIPDVQRRQIEHIVAEAMIEKAICEPEHMIDRARAETTLPDEIGFKVAQQLCALGLRRCQRRSCRHADFNQMRDEQPGKIGNLDLALRCRWQSPSQFDSKIWRQRRRCNGLVIEQATEASKQITIIFQRIRLVVSGRKAFFECCEILIKACMIGFFHFCAPC